MSKSAKEILVSEVPRVHQGRFYLAIRIHYMGVKTIHQGKGVGKMQLLFALDTCRELSEKIGINFVCIEALPSFVDFFKHHGFTRIHTEGNLVHMAQRIEDMK